MIVPLTNREETKKETCFMMEDKWFGCFGHVGFEVPEWHRQRY